MAEGFFSSAKQDLPESNNLPDDLDTFQQAIGRRFSTQDTSLFTSRMNLQVPLPTSSYHHVRAPDLSLGPSSAITSPSTESSFSRPLNAHTRPPPLTSIDLKGSFLSPHASAPPNALKFPSGAVRNGVVPKSRLTAQHSVSSKYIPIQPQTLESFINPGPSASSPKSLVRPSEAPQNVIVIDIRSHHYFLQSRIHSAINLSVPSMLLKRPTTSLEKLADMVAPISHRPIFTAWRSAKRIIVYDGDSTALTPGSNILSLLGKFENEGFTNSLCFLQGGFVGISKIQPSLIEDRPLTPPGNDESQGMLHSRKLPMAAFQQCTYLTTLLRRYLNMTHSQLAVCSIDDERWEA